MESFEIITIAANALNEKKGRDISAIKVGDLTVLADYFLLCTANSSTQVRALADEVEEKAKEAGFNFHHREGYNGESWVLIDFLDVIVHVFDRENREFYALEHLWEDAKKIDIEGIID